MNEPSVIPAVTLIVSQEDVTVELLCFQQALSALGDRRRAGKLWKYVEATLEANPGLASLGLLLPLGTRVAMPEFRIETAVTGTRRLWDPAE